ncbi:leucine-rich repeat extensin-like protein 3 isoform X3 [Balamuthia mandrillaris]
MSQSGRAESAVAKLKRLNSALESKRRGTAPTPSSAALINKSASELANKDDEEQNNASTTDSSSSQQQPQEEQQGSSISNRPFKKGSILSQLREASASSEALNNGEDAPAKKESAFAQLLKESDIKRRDGDLERYKQQKAQRSTPSVLEILQAGSVIKPKKKKAAAGDEEEGEKEAGATSSAASENTTATLSAAQHWLTAKEQKRSISTIKRSKEAKLAALEKLQAQLAMKREALATQKQQKQSTEQELAKMVSGSVIMNAAFKKGSRMVGRPIGSAPKSPGRGSPSASRRSPSPRKQPASLLAPSIAISTSSDKEKKEDEEQKDKEEPKKESTTLAKTKEAQQGRKIVGEELLSKAQANLRGAEKERVAQAKARRKREKELDAKSKALLKESKKLDQKQKQMNVDNQLTTFLQSLLKLEAAYRVQEEEKTKHLKQINELKLQNANTENTLSFAKATLQHLQTKLQGMVRDFPFDRESEFFKDMVDYVRSVEEITSKELGADIPSPPTSSSSSSSPASEGASAPPPPTPPPLAPAPPSAPSAPSAPPPPPLLSSGPSSTELNIPTAQRETRAKNGTADLLAAIRAGTKLKVVSEEELEKPPAASLGGIFQSLHDTLTAAMEVRKLALADSDDEDWDDGEEDDVEDW